MESGQRLIDRFEDEQGSETAESFMVTLAKLALECHGRFATRAGDKPGESMVDDIRSLS